MYIGRLRLSPLDGEEDIGRRFGGRPFPGRSLDLHPRPPRSSPPLPLLRSTACDRYRDGAFSRWKCPSRRHGAPPSQTEPGRRRRRSPLSSRASFLQEATGETDFDAPWGAAPSDGDARRPPRPPRPPRRAALAFPTPPTLPCPFPPDRPLLPTIRAILRSRDPLLAPPCPPRARDSDEPARRRRPRRRGRPRRPLRRRGGRSRPPPPPRPTSPPSPTPRA